MSNTKLTKQQRIRMSLNFTAILLYSASAILFIVAGNYIMAAIWATGAVVWVWVTKTWIKTDRLNNETAELRRQLREGSR